METLVGVLSFGTLGFFVVAAYVGARATEKMRESGAPKSSLSSDGIRERLAARKVAAGNKTAAQ